MAYNVKWYSEFADEGFNDTVPGEYLVEILDRDFDGVPIKVLSGETPFKAEMANIDNPFDAIRAFQFNVEWISQTNTGFEISDVFITDDRKYKIRFSKFNTSGDPVPIFHGYLAPINCEEPFNTKPYPVTLAATCGLPFLRDDYYLDAFGSFVEGKHSLIKIVANCLASSGHELDIHTYINLFEKNMPVGANSALQLAEIDADGLRGKKAIDVLEGILNVFGAFIVQREGAWIIKSVKDQTTFLGQVRRYNSNGDFLSFAEVRQSASFGRTAFNVNTPNVRPLSTVKESIAEQNSIVTINVSPGIPVNRLPNGSFSGPLLGGNLPGWNVSLNALESAGVEPAGWSRSGSNRPGDPYKMDMHGAIKRLARPGQPHVKMAMTGYIELNTGTFNSSKNAEPPKLKIKFSGAYRASDISYFSIFVRLNEGDRDYVSYLDASGTWTLTKKERDAKYARIDVAVPVNLPNSKDFSEALLQTFEIEADTITNYLNRSGQALCRIYFDIIAAEVLIGGNSDFAHISPRLTWEDFSVIVSTETAFEGDHSYRVDAKFPIRNPNTSDFTTIVADKIGIETPEQSRPSNRVMTGYMTLLNGNLTQEWRRYPDGSVDSSDATYEPIQKKALRERIRLSCGKRRIIEGPFKGYGLFPDQSVFNRYDSLDAPQNFFTITGWKWDVKRMEYDTTFHELDFTPLANEVIDIVGNEDGDRGNRQYSGGGGGSISGGSGVNPDPIEQIVMDDVDPIDFSVGELKTQIIDLGALIMSSHLPIDISAKVIYYPSWVEFPEEDRGVDGDLLLFTITGTPSIKDRDQIVIELEGTQGEDFLLVIPVRAFAKTITTASLLDKTGGESVIVGAIPGLYYVPDISDIATRIKGTHNKVVMTLKGGGPSGDAVNEIRTVNINFQVDDAIYDMFDQEGGKFLDVGSYTFTIESFFENVFRSSKDIKFTLYDEEYLAKYSAELWDTTKEQVLGVINPDGSSIFKDPVSFDVKSIISELDHDKIVLTLTKDGIAYPPKIYTLPDSELEGEYNLFDEVTTEYGPGKYELLVDVFLTTTQVYQRLVSWEIADKEILPQAGIQLIVFPENMLNYEVLADLPLNNSEFDLPDAYGFKIPVPAVDFDHQEWKSYDKTSGALLPIDIETYTNKPQFIDYVEGETPDDILLFDNKNSTQIGRLHRAPSSVRVISIFKKGGASGDIVAIVQADISFRVPLNPEDYSGLRFITFEVGSDAMEVTDANMPISGRTYLLPVYPKNWSVAARSYNGQIFDEVTLQLKKDGVFLHSFEGDYVSKFTSSTPLTEIDDDLSASIFGYPTDDERRYLINPDGEQVLIDDLGEVEVIATFKLAGVLVGTLDATFTFADAEEDLPIVDFEEVDPTVPQWVKDITEAEIAKWNTIEDYVLTADFPDLFDERFTELAGDYVRKSTADLITASHNFTGEVTFPKSSFHNTLDGFNIYAHYAPNGGNGVNASYANLRVWNGAGGWKALRFGGDGSFLWDGNNVATQTWVLAQNYLSSIAVLSAGVGLLGGSYNGTASKTFSIDFGTGSVQVPRGDDSRINNGQTAYNWGNHALAGYALSSSLTGYVRKATADNITADHNFTGIIKLPGNYGHNTYDGSNIYANYSPADGNGSVASIANLRVWNGSGGWRTLTFSGSGGFTWQGDTVALQPWVAANYVPQTRTVSAGTGLTGGGALSANITLAFDITFGDARYSVASHTHQTLSRGVGLTGSNYNGAAATTWAIDFGTSSVQVPRGDDSRINNGQTAYGWGNHASYGYATTASLSGYVSIATANTVTAAHNFTGNNLSLPGSTFHSTYDGTNIYYHFYPGSGNGGTSTVANLRIWDGSTGSYKLLRFGGDGVFTWDGNNIATQNWVSALGYVVTSRQVNSGTGLLGGGDLTANRTLSVDFGTGSLQVPRGDDSRINNGQTAFSWGNHAGAGYLTSSSLTGYVPNARNISAGLGLTGGGNLSADRSFAVDFGTGTFQVARGDDTRINNGATAYSWGNHAGFSYLTSINSGMVISALGYTPYNSSNPAGYISASLSNTYVPKYNGSGSLINSIMYDDGYTVYFGGQINSGNITVSGVVNISSGLSAGSIVSSSQVWSQTLRVDDTANFYGSANFNNNVSMSGYTSITNLQDVNRLAVGLSVSGMQSCAKVQIDSASQGFLLPRMTRAQRVGISSPVNGLMVYQTDTASGQETGFWSFENSAWRRQTYG